MMYGTQGVEKGSKRVMRWACAVIGWWQHNVVVSKFWVAVLWADLVFWVTFYLLSKLWTA